MRSGKRLERILTMWETRVVIYITLATVIIGFITAVIGMRRQNDRLTDIHVLVNGRYKAVNDRVEQLIATLKRHGIEIPDDPSIPSGPSIE